MIHRQVLLAYMAFFLVFLADFVVLLKSVSICDFLNGNLQSLTVAIQVKRNIVSTSLRVDLFIIQ